MVVAVVPPRGEAPRGAAPRGEAPRGAALLERMGVVLVVGLMKFDITIGGVELVAGLKGC
jgi:hypothetical protein